MAEPCKQSHGGAMRPTEPDKKHDKEVLPEKHGPAKAERRSINIGFGFQESGAGKWRQLNWWQSRKLP